MNMPPTPQPWPTIAAKRRSENFIGRAEQLKQFSDNFAVDIPDYLLFAVTGEGGVGKSTLLKQYNTLASTQPINAIVITCDDHHLSPVDVMEHITEQLAQHDFIHKDFNEHIKKYRELRQEVEGDPKAPREVLNLLASGLTDLTIKSLRKTPGIGVFFDNVDEKAAGDAFGQLVEYTVARWGNKDETALLHHPEATLTPLFIELLARVTTKRRLVLMFDVFERTADTITPWLQALLRFEYGAFNTFLTFVVSGRRLLERNWTEFAPLMARICLDPFTLDQTRQYLSNQHITDETIIVQIHADTGGLPVLVELLAATHPQPGQPLADISYDAVQRFLQWIPQEDRRLAALLAAVPRQFNQDILSATIGENTKNLYLWLSSQSYTRTNTERGAFYHEKVRELMLRHIHNTTPADLTAAHTRLAEFFVTEQTHLNLAGKAAYESETWRRLETERIYHTILAHPNCDLTIAADAFLFAFRWRWRYIQEIAQLCQQISHEIRLQKVDEFANHLTKAYLAYEHDDWPALLNTWAFLESFHHLQTPARSTLYAHRGLTYSQTGKYEQALSDYTKAIELDPSDANAYYHRGNTYADLKDYTTALANYTKAIELDPNEINIYFNRGITYYNLNDYTAALADIEHTIQLDPEDATAYFNCGLIHRNIKDFSAALADFTQVIALNPNDATSYYNRGLTYRNLKDYPAALSDFNRTIELDPTDANAYLNRGNTYADLEDFSAALADHTKTIELVPSSGIAYLYRGLTYADLKDYSAALADYTKAIELDPTDANAYYNRGNTYTDLKDYSAALADYTKTIELAPDSAVAYLNRGFTYVDLEDFTAALADHTKVIELDPNDANAYFYRGNAYTDLKDFTAALADHTKAIELAPNSGTAYLYRGSTYANLKDFAAALADYTKTVELDPNNATAYLNRGLIYADLKDFTAALADYTKVIELVPSSSTAYLNRGLTYADLKDFTAALADYTKAIELDPNNATAYRYHGNACFDLKDYPTALDNYTKAIELAPNDAKAYSNRGLTYHYIQDYPAALTDYAKAIELDPNDPSPIYNLACLYAIKSDLPQAIVHLRSAIQMDSSSLDSARTDTDFDSIRSTPEFQSILAEFTPPSS